MANYGVDNHTLRAITQMQENLRAIKSMQANLGMVTQMQENLRAVARMQENLGAVINTDANLLAITQMQEHFRVMNAALPDPARSVREMLRAAQMPSQVMRDVAAVQLPVAAIQELSASFTFPQAKWREMIEAQRPPLEAWASVLGSVRQTVEAATPAADWTVLIDEAAAELAAAEPDEEGDGNWLLRLSFAEQMGFYLLVLVLLDKLGEFMTDLAGGDDLPPEFRSGIEVLFAAAMVLHAVITAREKSKND